MARGEAVAAGRENKAWSPHNLSDRVWRWRFATILKISLLLSLLSAAVLLIILVIVGTPEDTGYLASGIWIMVGLGALSLVAEYIDSSIGLGYGTVVAPVLLLGGLEPVEVIPAILITEGISGLIAATLHHRAANVDFSVGSKDLRIAMIISLPAAAAAATAAAVATALPIDTAEIVIGLIVLAGGIIVLAGRRRSGEFSWFKAIGVGFVAAVAKGVSGGGFGPVSMTGQVTIGVPERNAVGITSLAEGIASVVGLAVFVVIERWPPLPLAVSLAVGGIVAIPAAVWTLHLLRPSTMRAALGTTACFLGILVLISAFLT